jgi:hypothetical protein
MSSTLYLAKLIPGGFFTPTYLYYTIFSADSQRDSSLVFLLVVQALPQQVLPCSSMV